MPPAELLSPQSLPKQRPAVTEARHERASGNAVNEVVGLHRAPRSCWDSIRFRPCEPTTFFARLNGHRKTNMKQSHELPKFITVEIPPEAHTAIHWYHRRHWQSKKRNQKTLREAAYDFCSMAFALPEQISHLADAVCDLRDGEGMTNRTALTTIIETHNVKARDWWRTKLHMRRQKRINKPID